MKTDIFVLLNISEYILSFLDDNGDEECEEYFSNSANSASGCCSVFA